jgi:hypothetical protein
MPSDVEKVQICRLSGARAGPDCRNHTAAELAPPSSSGPGVVTVGNTTAAPTQVMPDEPAVYEDLFPIGAVPSEICPLHDPSRVMPATTTPLVDAALQTAVGTTMSVIRQP